jgi:uncharacterized Zn finger protein (UPF0148 family)
MNQVFIINAIMDDLRIVKCERCKVISYRYNGQQCPICSEKKEQERLERDKQREREIEARLKELSHQ